MPFARYMHLWGPMTHCVKRGSLIPQRRGDLGWNPQPKRALTNCCCPLANRNEDSAFFSFYQITLVVVVIYFNLGNMMLEFGTLYCVSVFYYQVSSG